MDIPIKLTDQVTAPSRNMANGLAQAAKNGLILEKQMKAIEAASVKAAASGNVAQMKKLSASYAAAGSELQRLQGEFGGLEQAMRPLEPAPATANELAEAMGAIAGPAMIAVGAITALSAAVASLAWEGAKLALEATENKAKLLAAFSALGGGAAAGKETLNMIRELEKELPNSEAELATWAKQLAGAGVSGLKLRDALVAVAASGALGGESEKTMNLLAKLNEQGMKGGKLKFTPSMLVGTGLSEEDLMKALGMTPKELELAKKQGKLTGEQLSDAIVKALKAKGKGPLEEAMSELSTQLTKFKENVQKLFEDVNVKPFLDELAKLGKLFDQGTASGKALKFLVTQTFNAIFTVAAKALPYVKAFLEGLIIGGLKAYIALKPLFRSLQDALRFFTLLGESALGAATAIGKLYAAVQALGAYMGLGGKGAGGSLVDGIVSGITGRMASAIASAKALGTGVLGAIKGTLGIASPSRAFMQVGAYAGEGLALGMGAQTDKIAAAGAGMGGAALGGAGKGAGKGKGGGDVHVTVSPGAIVLSASGGDAASLKASLQEGVALLFEQAARSAGLGDAAGAAT